MRRAQWGLAALVALIVAVTFSARAQVPKDKNLPEFKVAVAKQAKVKQKTSNKILDALGPVIQAQLKAGRPVEIPGLGTFRVVRVSAYRDLVNGLPTTVPARNYVEFVPSAELTATANSPGAVPARTVEGYQFRVNPNQAPSVKSADVKVPRSRGNSRQP
jgi:nucleoid DNA-binding protein